MASTTNQDESVLQGSTRAGGQISLELQEEEEEKEEEEVREGNREAIIDSPSPGLTKKAAQEGWDSLDYLPLLLTKKGLSAFLILNCAIMEGLVTLQQKPAFIVNTASYYALTASLILLGTATVAHLEAVFLSLSRMRPFILCARNEGATAADTILGRYFPAPRLRDAWETGSWMLLVAYAIYLPSYALLGLKSALLYESISSDELNTNDWACYTLLVFYGITQFYLLAVMAYLWKRPTGLRWDPVSIADVLVLFRHCNFLNTFEGSSIAERQSMVENLGNTRVYLRYWSRENGDFWQGFGTDPPAQHPPDEHTGSRSTALRGDALRDSAPVSNKEATTQHPSPGEARLPSGIESPQRRRSYDEHTDSRSTGLGGDALGDGALARNEEATTQHPSPGESRLPSETRKTSGIDIEKLALMRYNSAWSVANPASVYVHLSLALLFMTLFIIGVSVASGLTAPGRYYCWIPAGLSRIQANLLFDVVLTTAVGFLSKFWTSLSIFVAHTEPLAQMARPCGGPAKHTLLLNYTFSFLPVRIYNAFRNKHWKLVRVVIWGLIQRFFPTLVGSSITVYSVGLEESDDRCVVCFSMPLFVVIIVGFAACAGFIVYELLLASVFRRTPRDYLSIADIVSWSSTSSLLHPTATDIAQEESPLVDPLHVEVEGEKGKRWYMQYRLELQLDHFRLGYAKVPDREYYAFGITDEEPERLPVVRPTRLARRLVADSESGKEKGLAKKLEVVIGNGSISYVKLVSASENTGVTYLNATVPKGNYQDEEGQPDQNN